MNKINRAELDSALVDVRKAYRLLYAYQRRIMDTTKFIADILSKNVNSGFAVYSANAPKNGSKLDLDRWAWDWLNMYMYEFHFGISNVENNNIQFAIIFQSDTGAFDSEEVKMGTEIELFDSPEESETRVIFQLGKNRWKPDGYNDCDYFSKKTSDVFEELEDESKFFIAKSYPLSDLMNVEGIFIVLNNFITFSKEKGVKGFFNDAKLIKD